VLKEAQPIIGIRTPASAGDVPAWAQERLLAWYAAYNAEDAKGLADLYTSDARAMTVSGRSEIIAAFESQWAEHDISCSGDYDGFQIVWDLATGWGHDNCIKTPKSGGESNTGHIRWLAFMNAKPTVHGCAAARSLSLRTKIGSRPFAFGFS